MSLPLISMVLCTYNGEKFIEEQINSLLKQTYSNIEIIISDDASADNTAAILNKYKTNSVIKVFLQQTNLGSIKNFEFAIRQTRGEFITFSDQDDIWLPDKIQTMYDAIGGSYLIYSDSELIDETGNSLHTKLSQLRRMYTGNQTTGFVFSNVVWGHAMLIDRKLVEHVIPIPKDIAHDIWMGFKATTITGIRYLDIPLTKYRQHQATFTKTIAVKARPRSREKRYRDFEKELQWIGIMRDHEREDYKALYSQLYNLYSQKSMGRYVWRLFFFLLWHRKDLFMFTRKKWISHIVEIFKQARGESR